MKFLLATILATAASVQGATGDSPSFLRALQQNNYNYNGYNGGGGYQYENYEQYLRAEIASKTFTFTGCSSTTTEYGYNQVYATFRICDQCNTMMNSQGCSASNGDYIIDMREFGEAFGEYWEQTSWQNRDLAPYRCVRAEEYAGAYYQAKYYNNNAQQQYYQNENQYYNRNQGGQGGQDQEYFIGPICSGGSKVEIGAFWDENCAFPVEKWSAAQVLGFDPNSGDSQVQPPKCVPCASSQYNYNGNGDVELNPLCDRLLEDAGRCDRSEKETSFDAAWQNARQQDRENQNNYYYGANQGCSSDLTYYQCQNKRTCDLIDSLSILPNQAARSAGIALIILASLSAVAALVYFARSGRLGLKGVNLSPKKKVPDADEDAGGDYHREIEPPSVTVN